MPKKQKTYNVELTENELKHLVLACNDVIIERAEFIRQIESKEGRADLVPGLAEELITNASEEREVYRALEFKLLNILK